MPEQQPMTEAMYYLLLALLRPAHGYLLMQQVAEVSDGRLSMGPGTLYGLLNKLEKGGLVQLCGQDERRKTYELTDEGKTALKREYRRLRQLVRDGENAEVERL